MVCWMSTNGIQLLTGDLEATGVRSSWWAGGISDEVDQLIPDLNTSTKQPRGESYLWSDEAGLDVLEPPIDDALITG